MSCTLRHVLTQLQPSVYLIQTAISPASDYHGSHHGLSGDTQRVDEDIRCGRATFVMTRSLTDWLKKPITDDALCIHTIYSAVSPPVHPSSRIDVDDHSLIFCILFEMERLDLMEDLLKQAVTDNDLPLSMESLRDLFIQNYLGSHDDTASEFYKLQWRYFPAKFEMFGSHMFKSETVLPVSRRLPIGVGTTAHIWQMVIPREFIDGDLAQALEWATFDDTENQIGPVIPECFLTVLTIEAIL